MIIPSLQNAILLLLLGGAFIHFMYAGSRPYPPGRSRSVQTVAGTKPHATAKGKFLLSMPALKLIGISAPMS